MTSAIPEHCACSPTKLSSELGAILVPRAYDPSGLRQESKALGAIISGMPCGRRGGLMVSALDSGANGPGSSPGWGHCVVFLGKTLYWDWGWHALRVDVFSRAPLWLLSYFLAACISCIWKPSLLLWNVQYQWEAIQIRLSQVLRGKSVQRV